MMRGGTWKVASAHSLEPISELGAGGGGGESGSER